jgi:hypothetical protein
LINSGEGPYQDHDVLEYRSVRLHEELLFSRRSKSAEFVLEQIKDFVGCQFILKRGLLARLGDGATRRGLILFIVRCTFIGLVADFGRQGRSALGAPVTDRQLCELFGSDTLVVVEIAPDELREAVQRVMDLSAILRVLTDYFGAGVEDAVERGGI